MSWRVRPLTGGTDQGRFHAHSYYDIPVWNEGGDAIVAYGTSFAERMPVPEDQVEIGLVRPDADASDGDAWTPIGTSRAWSWQQGPMAQFVPRGGGIVWNDRAEGGFRAVLRRADGAIRRLDRPVYALSPDGRTALSLDMARLEALRPGYGYAVEERAALDRLPRDDGVWRVPLDGTPPSLLLSLRDAREALFAWLPLRERLRHRAKRYAYWFNHVKLSLSGERYTVKLRWRVPPGGHWDDRQGVSLTGAVAGGEVRVLTDRTSHVIWEDDETLFLWHGEHVERFADEAPAGRLLGPIAPEVLTENVHIRARPNHPGQFFFDTPYREKVALRLLDERSSAVEDVATFENHRPKRGPYRCDLHPVPSPDGGRVLVTSLRDGGRQLYLAERA